MENGNFSVYRREESRERRKERERERTRIRGEDGTLSLSGWK